MFDWDKKTPDLPDVFSALTEESGPAAATTPTAPVVPPRLELFLVDRDEAIVVAEHWIEFLQRMNLHWQWHQQYSRRDEEDKDHARWRLNLLCDRLGADVLRRMQERSDAKARERIGRERWRIYTAGTDAERLQFAEDNQTQTDGFMQKFYDDTRADRAFARLHGDPALTYTDADGDVWFFGARDCTAADKLNLALRTADGSVGYDGSRSIDRPAGWTASPVAIAAA